MLVCKKFCDPMMTLIDLDYGLSSGQVLVRVNYALGCIAHDV